MGKMVWRRMGMRILLVMNKERNESFFSWGGDLFLFLWGRGLVFQNFF